MYLIVREKDLPYVLDQIADALKSGAVEEILIVDEDDFIIGIIEPLKS
ncbi:MAG: hypothetical protein KDJ35_05290 [Alphaproteobacteria bacterium]|nr:hypothetical protein [Alphaproteobacteria bacterium]